MRGGMISRSRSGRIGDADFLDERDLVLDQPIRVGGRRHPRGAASLGHVVDGGEHVLAQAHAQAARAPVSSFHFRTNASQPAGAPTTPWSFGQSGARSAANAALAGGVAFSDDHRTLVAQHRCPENSPTRAGREIDPLPGRGGVRFIECAPPSKKLADASPRASHRRDRGEKAVEVVMAHHAHG